MPDAWKKLVDSVDRLPVDKREKADVMEFWKSLGFQMVPVPTELTHMFQVGQEVSISQTKWTKGLLKIAAAAKPAIAAMMKVLEMDVPERGVILALLTRNEVLIQGTEGRVWVQRVYGDLVPKGKSECLLALIDVNAPSKS